MLSVYTLNDVKQRDGKNGNEVWVVIRDIVYNVSPYLADHPGGNDLLFEYAGQDGTTAFENFGHSSDAIQELKKLKIGVLTQEDKKANCQSCVLLPSGEVLCSAPKRKRSRLLLMCR